MSCSNPWRLYASDIKPNRRNDIQLDHELNALRYSLNNHEYYTVPCGYCVNCRQDRINQFVDRAEYEYSKFGSGAFVTFTYDDYHLNPYQYIDARTGKLTSTLSRKDGKDFLNRLNKIVHKFVKENGNSALCNKDYKYVLTGEYGDKFERPHFHCLFFGLDFAYCKRLFWRAWQGRGAIQVNPIRSGGIKYCVKYISSSEFGEQAFLKYDLHKKTRPYSVHSTKFGYDLYLSQLKYIKEHNGNYRWHNTDRPVPKYFKDKFLITSHMNEKYIKSKYIKNCNNIYNLYNHRITSYKDFEDYNLRIARTRKKNIMNNLRNHGYKVYDDNLLMREIKDIEYGNVNRSLNRPIGVCTLVRPDGSVVPTLRTGQPVNKLSVRELMRLGTDYKTLKKQFGFEIATKIVGLDTNLPF